MNQEQYYDELVKIEREKLGKKQSVLERHFGAIIGAGVSFGAIAVSIAQVWVAHIESSSQLNHERQESLRQEARAREESLSASRIQLASFALEQRDLLYSKDGSREVLLRVFAATFPGEVTEPFLAALAEQVVEPGVRDEIDAVRQSVVEQIAPRVYFHIASESQRERANALAGRLETLGWVVPGVEYKETSPATSQLRVFKAAEVPEAQSIAEDLAKLGANVRVTDLSARYGNSTAIRARHYELGLGRDY